MKQFICAVAEWVDAYNCKEWSAYSSNAESSCVVQIHTRATLITSIMLFIYTPRRRVNAAAELEKQATADVMRLLYGVNDDNGTPLLYRGLDR